MSLLGSLQRVLALVRLCLGENDALRRWLIDDSGEDRVLRRGVPRYSSGTDLLRHLVVARADLLWALLVPDCGACARRRWLSAGVLIEQGANVTVVDGSRHGGGDARLIDGGGLANLQVLLVDLRVRRRPMLGAVQLDVGSLDP